MDIITLFGTAHNVKISKLSSYQFSSMINSRTTSLLF